MSADRPTNLDDNHYDDPLAALYDHSPLLSVGDDHPSVDHYRRLADKYGGPVLQVGVATGRLALPIARDGHEVVGVDISESVLRVLGDKLAGEPAEVRRRVTTVRGDMRSLALERTFPLVLMAGSVFLYNLTQRDQLAALTRARRHLTPDGALALDVFTMDIRLLGQQGPVTSSYRFRDDEGAEHLAEQTTLVDPLRQLEVLRMVHRRICPNGQLDAGTFSELTMRYVSPAELHLLLLLAGFRILRFGGDFDTESPKVAYDGPQVVVAEPAVGR